MSKRNKLLGALLAVAVTLLALAIAANFGTSLLAAIMVKDTYVGKTESVGKAETGGPGVIFVDGSGSLIGTAEAKVAVPMYVIPVLEDDTIHQIKSAQLTYYDKSRNASVIQHVTITGARHYSATSIELFCVPSTSTALVLRLRDGEAHLVEGHIEHRVCAAKASCSSVKIGSGELDGLFERADAALEAAGIDLVGSHARKLHFNDGRRQLYWCGYCAAKAEAYAGCAEADKAGAGTDAAPACIAHVLAEMGLSDTFNLNNVPQDCTFATDTSLVQLRGSSEKAACSDTIISQMCPATCGQEGQIRQLGTESLQDKSTPELGKFKEAEEEEVLGDHFEGDRWVEGFTEMDLLWRENPDRVDYQERQNHRMTKEMC